MTTEAEFENVLQLYAHLQDSLERRVREACGGSEERVRAILEIHRAVIKATLDIERERSSDPAFDAYVDRWTKKRGGSTPSPRGERLAQ